MPAGGSAEAGGWGSIIGTYAGTTMSKALDDDQSLERTFWMTDDGGTPASARGLAAGAATVAVSGGAAKAAAMSKGKDSLDDGDGDDDGGDNDDDGDDNDRAINLPDNAAAAATNNDDNDESVPRKTLVTATIRRKTDATDADIPEGRASNGQTMKFRQCLSLTFKALALPRSGCF
jgi:hypothetical protein